MNPNPRYAKTIRSLAEPQLQTIGKSSEGVFIGYIVALSIGSENELVSHYSEVEESLGSAHRMFDCTEYRGEQVWSVVPDTELFQILLDALLDSAKEREVSDAPGIGKYYVYWTAERGWSVDLP
jgi:hypothetical protein